MPLSCHRPSTYSSTFSLQACPAQVTTLSHAFSLSPPHMQGLSALMAPTPLDQLSSVARGVFLQQWLPTPSSV